MARLKRTLMPILLWSGAAHECLVTLKTAFGLSMMCPEGSNSIPLGQLLPRIAVFIGKLTVYSVNDLVAVIGTLYLLPQTCAGAAATGEAFVSAMSHLNKVNQQENNENHDDSVLWRVFGRMSAIKSRVLVKSCFQSTARGKAGTSVRSRGYIYSLHESARSWPWS